MILWTTIMMNILNVDINCRTTILESNDMWNDVHMNKDFHKYLHKYSYLVSFFASWDINSKL